jgi:hypothetical protein
MSEKYVAYLTAVSALYHMQIRNLRDSERDIRYKALLAADELLSVPLGLVQSISAGVAEALASLLTVWLWCYNSSLRRDSCPKFYTFDLEPCCRMTIVRLGFLL